MSKSAICCVCGTSLKNIDDPCPKCDKKYKLDEEFEKTEGMTFEEHEFFPEALILRFKKGMLDDDDYEEYEIIISCDDFKKGINKSAKAYIEQDRLYGI